MFKTDKASLETLSFLFDETDIARFRRLIDLLKREDLSSLPQQELERLTLGLDEIGKLKLDGKVYAFNVYDSYAERQGNGEGVELYLRQGNKLIVFYQPSDRDRVFSAEQAARYLKKENITTIYTGNIDYIGEFLGLHATVDSDDPIERKILEASDIAEFSSEGIEVVVLDSLI